MKTAVFTLAVLTLMASPAMSQPVTVCESDGNYRECRLDGVGFGTLVRQMSDAACIEGQTWGYRDGRIWVDRGCRASFAMTSLYGSAPLDTRVVCEAGRDGVTRCAANTLGGVQIARRISKSGCELGRDWGYDRNGIWVTNGCRAEFAVASNNSIVRTVLMPLDARLVCESRNNGMTRCATNTLGGVQLMRRISDAGCEYGRDWGYDRDGIWVNHGCRAEFAVPGNTAFTQAVSFPQNERILCESQNNGRTRCATNTTGGVQLTRRVSNAGCEFGRDWGYDRDGIWVDNGCRAEFYVSGNRVVTTAGMPATTTVPVVASNMPTMATSTLVCESNRDGRNHCRADTTMGVLLTRQLSDASCRLNRTWGFDDDGVWVSSGCRAEFTTVDGRFRGSMVSSTGGGRAPLVLCESENNGHKHCRADTRFGVSLVRQISDAKCERDRSWGVDDVGIWVTNGCRGEFALERR